MSFLAFFDESDFKVLSQPPPIRPNSTGADIKGVAKGARLRVQTPLKKKEKNI
jgi:hypothetical protein